MKRRDRLIILLLVGSGLMLGGCAGGSGGGGGRSLSEVVDEDEKKGRDAQRESRTRGDDSRTRTRTDHQETYESDDDNDSSGSVVGWLVGALFGGDDDYEPEEYDYSYEEQEQDYVATSPYVEDEIGGEDMGSTDGPNLSIGRFSVGYRYSWSYLAGDAIEGFDTWMVTVGLGPKDGIMMYLGAYFGKGEFERSDVAANLEDLSEEGLELGIRIYLTPDHTLLGSYLKLGGRIGDTQWKYRDPQEITTDDGGVTRVTDDWVLNGGPFVGAGLSILQTRHLHLGASVMTGISFTASETDKGFTNDLFQDVGWYQWNLEGRIRF